MKSILLNVNPDLGQEARLATAIALAKSRGSHLICVQCLPPPIVGEPGVGLTVIEMIEAEERMASKVKEEIEIRLELASVHWTWFRTFGNAGAEIVSHARLADIILLSAVNSIPPISSVSPRARSPILAVPEMDPGFAPETHMLIAWNGSHAAANALRTAVPLLHNAKSVQILTVDQEDELFPAARAFEYLAHQAIRSDVHWRRGDGRPVAEAILIFAAEFATGMIVAGAFGHNRIREMLLGSVTRGLLKDSEIPLFLGH
jgi:nucleotide-binding universal stress UspA family protein